MSRKLTAFEVLIDGLRDFLTEDQVQDVATRHIPAIIEEALKAHRFVAGLPVRAPQKKPR